MKKFTLLITLVTMFGLTVSAQAELYDRGSGLIYDSDLDITWLVDESFANESMKWDEAIEIEEGGKILRPLPNVKVEIFWLNLYGQARNMWQLLLYHLREDRIVILTVMI